MDIISPNNFFILGIIFKLVISQCYSHCEKLVSVEPLLIIWSTNWSVAFALKLELVGGATAGYGFHLMDSSS